MKVALVILIALITASPSSNQLELMGAKTNSNTVNLPIESVPDDAGEASRFDWAVKFLHDWDLKRTSPFLIPNPFGFESGLQFLPRCKPGDEKPEFIPTEWNNHLLWLWWKGIDK